jgi:hypothetical protein
MKIRRTRLLELVDQQIARREKDQARRQAELIENENRSREKALRLAPAWDEFARRILDSVIDDKPVTMDLVPHELRAGYSDSLRFFKPSRSGAESNDVAADLKALKLFLEATLDEDVNTTSLERQGFSLGRVLRGA